MIFFFPFLEGQEGARGIIRDRTIDKHNSAIALTFGHRNIDIPRHFEVHRVDTYKIISMPL